MECSGDPASAAVTLFQTRYALPIVHALLSTPLHFNALRRALNAPSAATLRLRLAELIHAGVVVRSGNTYHLTTAGEALTNVFTILSRFTIDHPTQAPQIILQVLQHRHAMTIMRTLRSGPLTFNDLQRAVGAPSATTLTRRLQELEQVGLVTRTPIPGPPVRVCYAHSAAGHDFSAVIGTLLAWGEQHLHDSAKSAVDATHPDSHGPETSE